jgi:molybdate transport system permease protein
MPWCRKNWSVFIRSGAFPQEFVASWGVRPWSVFIPVLTDSPRALQSQAIDASRGHAVRWSTPETCGDPEGSPPRRERARSVKPPPHDLAPLWLSLRVAALATALIIGAGTPLALLLARGRFPGRGVLAGVLSLPLVLPPTVLGYELLQVLGRRAWLGSWLEHTWGITLVFHWTGAVVASAVAAFPLYLLPARGAFAGVDPALEDAARLLGRREASVFLAVTLPLAWRGLAAGGMLAFARALGDFGASMMVAGDIPGRTQTASMAIYDAVNANQAARAGWLTLWISLLAIVVLGLVQRLLPGPAPAGDGSPRR